MTVLNGSNRVNDTPARFYHSPLADRRSRAHYFSVETDRLEAARGSVLHRLRYELETSKQRRNLSLHNETLIRTFAIICITQLTMSDGPPSRDSFAN